MMVETNAAVLSSLLLPDLDLSYGASNGFFQVGAYAGTAGPGIDHVTLTLDRAYIDQSGNSTSQISFTNSADFVDGEASQLVYFNSGTAAGTYHIAEAVVVDKAGKAVSYSDSQLRSLGIRDEFAIATAHDIDTLRPNLSGVNLPADVNTSRQTEATFGLYGSDVGNAGLLRGTITLDRPIPTTAGMSNMLTLTNVNAGSLTTTLSVSPAASGVYSIVGATLTDGADNTAIYSKADLQTLFGFRGGATQFTVNDMTKPVLTSLSLPTVDVSNGSALPTASVTVADAANNAVEVTLTFDRPFLFDISGPGSHGLHSTYGSSVITLSSYTNFTYGPRLDYQTKAGTYDLTQVVVTDRAGNSTSYSAVDLAAKGFATSLTVAADAQAPTIGGFAAPGSPIVIGSGMDATFTAQVTDTGSTIGRAGAVIHLDRLLGFGSELTLSSQGGYDIFYPGTFDSGDTGTTTFAVGTGAKAGLYTLAGVTTFDAALNQRDYGAAELHAMGYVTAFVVANAARVDGAAHIADGFYAITGGAGADEIALNGNARDYTLSRQAGTGLSTQVDGDGAFVLTANNGGSIYYIDQSIERVTFQNGQYLALKDVTAYVAAGVAPTATTSDAGHVYQKTLGGLPIFYGDDGDNSAVLNGTASDYTVRPISATFEGTGRQLDGYVLFATNRSGMLLIDDSIEHVVFRNDRYVALRDLPSAVAADGGSRPEGTIHVVQATSAAGLNVTGTAANDILLIDTKLSDPYSLYTAGRTDDGAFRVLSSGQQFTIDQSIDTIMFTDGQYLALKDLPAYVYGDYVFTNGTAADDVLYAGLYGDQYLVGRGGTDLAEIHGNTSDYLLRPATTAAHDSTPAIDGIELLGLNGSGNVFIDRSVETVRLQDGRELAFADLANMIRAQSITASDGSDAFLAAGSGDQYFTGGGGADDLYLLGNVADYRLSAVALPASSTHAAIDGYELRATNGSGDLFVDRSIETLHFQNGQYVAFGDLPGIFE